MSSESPRTTFSRFLIVVLFAVAFAYIESAVVVYLRVIFYPEGFTFPLRNLLKVDPAQKYLVLTEVGREAATLVLILTACILFGRNRRQRFAYFVAIFAVWDIFYYVWLKVILGWPASIMDWDILFMIPTIWASAVLYPLIISAIMLVFAVVILHRDAVGKPMTVAPLDWLIFAVASVVIAASFCTAGPYIDKADYKTHFYWPVFALGAASAVAAFVRCLCRPQQSPK
jgi:multisubunit Na+/H+ antiporter MnhC subunit